MKYIKTFETYSDDDINNDIIDGYIAMRRDFQLKLLPEYIPTEDIPEGDFDPMDIVPIHKLKEFDAEVKKRMDDYLKGSKVDLMKLIDSFPKTK